MTGPADPALGLVRGQRQYTDIDARLAFDRVRAGNMARKVACAEVPSEPSLFLCTKGGVGRAIRDWWSLSRLGRGYDAIHVHSSHDHALAAWMRNRPCLVRSIHHPRSVVRRRFQGLAYRRTDGFIFVVEAHRRAFLSAYPEVPEHRTAVVSPAVDPKRFGPSADGRALRQAYGIPADAFVVGMVARIKAGRGHALLVDAFRRVSVNGRSPWLVFVGKGEGVDVLRADVDRAGIGARTRFFGFRDGDLPEAIAACDATVLLREGNDAGCRAVLESMAVGVPVIGASLPAVEHILGPGSGGFLVPADDVGALSEAISRWASLEGSVLRAMGLEGRKRVLEAFTDQQRAERVSAFYQHLFEARKMAKGHSACLQNG